MSYDRYDRLKWARERAGYSEAASFARAHGLNEVTYRSHENGQRGFKNATAQQYARLLRVSYEWLQTGRGAPTKDLTHALVGYVGAGAEIHPVDDGPLDSAPDPPGDGALAEVLQVKGDSMYPAYNNGDLIYLLPKVSSLDDAVGRECSVQIRNGARLLKRVQRGSAKGKYTLLSYNAPPLVDVKLEWAAPVDWIKRK